MEQIVTFLTKLWQSIQARTARLFNWTARWNRDLPPHERINHRMIWPLFIAPFALLNQLVTPHPIWVVLLVMLAGMYGISYYWVRSQAQAVTLRRTRIGTLLVAGDALRE